MSSTQMTNMAPGPFFFLNVTYDVMWRQSLDECHVQFDKPDFNFKKQNKYLRSP